MLRAFLFAGITALLLGLGAPSSAAPAEPVLSDLSVLADPEGRETIGTVSSGADRFQPLPGGMLAAGYTRSVRWIRFTVTAPPGDWWLDLMPAYLDDLRLFSPVPARPGEFTERRAGDRVPFSQRDLPYRGHVLRVTHADGAPVTYYLRLETTSSSILVPRAHSPPGFLAEVAVDYGFQLATLGALLVVLVLNAVSGYWVREPLTLWFLAYLATLAGNVAGNADIPAQFLFPDSGEAPDAWTRLASLTSIAAGNAFHQRLFSVGRDQPAIHGIYLAATAAPLLAIPFAFAGHYPEAMRLLIPMVLAMNALGLLLATRQWREGRPGSGLVLAAIALGFGGLIAFLLVLMGAYASHAVLLYGLQVTTLGSLLAMHVALAARSASAREERMQLAYLAHHDPLTQLPNRTLFFDRLGQAIARARRQRRSLALLLVDLDHFKPVNDAWGHPVGDLVLREAARRMAASVRASDTVGRIGGDEFVALLPDIDTAEAARGVARKLREAVAAPYLVEGHALAIDCCVGIAIFPRDGRDEVSLVNNADRAMYDAKRVAPGSIRACGDPQPAPSGEPA